MSSTSKMKLESYSFSVTIDDPDASATFTPAPAPYSVRVWATVTGGTPLTVKAGTYGFMGPTEPQYTLNLDNGIWKGWIPVDGADDPFYVVVKAEFRCPGDPGDESHPHIMVYAYTDDSYDLPDSHAARAGKKKGNEG